MMKYVYSFLCVLCLTILGGCETIAETEQPPEQPPDQTADQTAEQPPDQTADPITNQKTNHITEQTADETDALGNDTGTSPADEAVLEADNSAVGNSNPFQNILAVFRPKNTPGDSANSSGNSSANFFGGTAEPIIRLERDATLPIRGMFPEFPDGVSLYSVADMVLGIAPIGVGVLADAWLDLLYAVPSQSFSFQGIQDIVKGN